MASYSVSCSDTSVTMRVSGIRSGQTVEFYIRLNSGSTPVVNRTYTATSTSMTKSFSGLSPGTKYACNVKLDGTWIGTQYFTTDDSTSGPTISIDPWSWSSSNGSASASQTRSAYNAVSGNGYTSDFSYLVWNDMVDKVKEILDASGSSWYNGYASYSQTKMSYSDREMTARRFNALRDNIGQRVATGINPVSNGDTVYGWYFTRLTDRINTWIRQL